MSRKRTITGTKLEIALAIKKIRDFNEDDFAAAFGLTRQGLTKIKKREEAKNKNK